jgi:hypothetical protein
MFEFVKRLQVPQNSIFYSLIQYKHEILGFGRSHYTNGRKIDGVKFDSHFNIIEKDHFSCVGEDPRCFIHRDKLYILNNYFDNGNLVEYESKSQLKLNLSGKNFSFISHNNTLYIIHYIKPLQLFKIDLDSVKIQPVEVEDDGKNYDYEYRGGTPGYKIDESSYYGFGHRTYYVDDNLHHDVFQWILRFGSDRPTIQIVEVPQPPNSKNVCDPTSVINVDGIDYMITAESDYAWFQPQDYVNNVYKIVW